MWIVSLKERSGLLVDTDANLRSVVIDFAAAILFDPQTGRYVGPQCPGYHTRPACVDPKCEIRSRDHSEGVRGELQRKAAQRKAEEERRHAGPSFGHETDTDDD